jgi:UDP-glucose 4-epimerase
LNVRLVSEGKSAGDVEKIYGNVTKAAKLMHWKTEKTLDDSMRDGWRWEKKVRGI